MIMFDTNRKVDTPISEKELKRATQRKIQKIKSLRRCVAIRKKVNEWIPIK